MSVSGLRRLLAVEGTWTPETIRALRRDLRMSQEALARTIGRSTSGVQKLELGRRSAGADTRRALDALALGALERVG